MKLKMSILYPTGVYVMQWNVTYTLAYLIRIIQAQDIKEAFSVNMDVC